MTHTGAGADPASLARRLIPCAAFVGPFVGTAIVVALPQMSAELGLDHTQAGWFTAAYFLAAAVLMLPVSRAGDLYGRSRVLAGGLAVIAVAGLACTLVTDPAALIALRLLQGAGAAGVFGTAAPALADIVPPGERGRALGLNITLTYLGLTAGPGLGGLLTQYFGWRSIFYVGALWGLPVAVALWYVLPHRKPAAPAKRERFDLLGAALFGVALALLMLGSGRPTHGDGIAAMAAGVGLLAAFWYWQGRANPPLLSPRLVARGQALRYAVGAALLHYTGTFALAYLLSLMLQAQRGFSAGHVGLLLAIQPALQTLLATPAGRLADRMPAHRLTTAGLLIAAAGMALIPLTVLLPQTWLVASALALIGGGTALFVPPNATSALASVAARDYGIAIGLLQTMRLVGQMASMALALLIIGATGAGVTGYGQTLVIAAVVFTTLVLGAAGISARGARRVVTPAARD